MFKLPPKSRQRLYSSLSGYWSILRDVISGRVHRGDDVELLEQTLRETTGVEHAMCVPQARIGLYLGVKALLADGAKRRVIMSPYTIFDVVNMVISAGGKPCFADIERETCNIDPEAIERLIDDDTAAVLVTHLHGLVCDMERVVEICRKRGVALIEDAAQAYGVRFAGRRVGTFGDIGVHSFGMMKNVNSLFGGVVLTSQSDLAARIRADLETFEPVVPKRILSRALYGALLDLATYPPLFRTLTFWVFRYGFLHNVGPINMLSRSEQNPVLRRELLPGSRVRFSQAQARLVLKQLPWVDPFAEARIGTADLYFDALEGVEGVQLPPKRSDKSHTYMAFPIQVEDRHTLLRHLMTAGRDVAGQHIRNCAELPAFSEYKAECPNARLAAESVVLLPTYPSYGRKEAAKTAAQVKSYFDETKDQEPV